jgi:2-keto-3-deoxy-L-rhamnonate aldolase RhmA
MGRRAEKTMEIPFGQVLRSGGAAIGTLVTVDSPQIAEVLALCGYDWLFIDMEHSTLGIAEVQRLVQAAGGRCHAVVRVAENSDVCIKRALDIGCDGILVPQVNTAEDARRAVRAAKYPPLGARSVGIARAQGYGLGFAEYVRSANERTSVIAQIENAKAVDNIDEILRVDGLDALFIGPYDLSGSLNRLGEVDSDAVQQAIETVRAACRQARMPLGIFAADADTARAQVAAGCAFVAVGIDLGIFARAAREVLERVRS